MFLSSTDIGCVMDDKSESTSISDDTKVPPKWREHRFDHTSLRMKPFEVIFILPVGMGWIKNPHDTFFRGFFSIPSCANSIVQDQLPDEIVKLLADKEPKILEGSLVSDDLHNSQTDLLMEVEMASGESGFIYVLVEHKSYPDGGAPLDAGLHGSHIQYAREDSERTAAQALPPIIPVLGDTTASDYSCSWLYRYAAVDGTTKFCGYDRDR